MLRLAAHLPALVAVATVSLSTASAQPSHGTMCRDEQCGTNGVRELVDGVHVQFCCYHIDGFRPEAMDPVRMSATMYPADAPARYQHPRYGDTGRCPTNHCGCDPGYEGIYCQDIDECAINTHDCVEQATCNNTPGGFTCDCNDGYTGDGSTACNPDPPPTHPTADAGATTTTDTVNGSASSSSTVSTPTPTPTPAAAAAARPAAGERLDVQQPEPAAASTVAPTEGVSTGGVVLACLLSMGATVAGLWAWSRHAASRSLRERLETRLADFDHDPEPVGMSPGVGVIPRGTVWATISRLTKTLSNSSPMPTGDPRDVDSPSASSTSSSANVDTV